MLILNSLTTESNGDSIYGLSGKNGLFICSSSVQCKYSNEQDGHSPFYHGTYSLLGKPTKKMWIYSPCNSSWWQTLWRKIGQSNRAWKMMRLHNKISFHIHWVAKNAWQWCVSTAMWSSTSYLLPVGMWMCVANLISSLELLTKGDHAYGPWCCHSNPRKFLPWPERVQE